MAKLLHWIIALMILGLIWLGWWMVGLTYYDVWYNDSLTIHKSLGMFVLGLALLKLVWLVVSPTPEPLPSLKTWEQAISRVVHWTLISSMFLIPITGYFISTSEGDGISIFGWFEIPALFAISESARDLAIDIHYYASYAILAVAIVHAGAAMKHQIIEKDGTLKRML